ncbi:MAG: TIGR03936 family radical SAM-associated protein [Spirochaetales bacterium]|nr:TIGR03936 family radical SAM-associated protein [Spirochaetales bacterium]
MTSKTLPEGINPSVDLAHLLASVEKPGRYVGGEWGALRSKPQNDDWRICVVFPDLYEIGMSNQAVRILYKMFNDEEGLHAERAFSPALDFEKGLAALGQPLYSLENGLPIHTFDLLAITIGYELAFTNVLSFLKASHIPIDRNQRGDEHPLILLGGPAMTNPAPWSPFVDGVFIGEAEDGAIPLMQELRTQKAAGASRAELQALLDAHPGIWTPAAPHADRRVWNDFAQTQGLPAANPIPSMVTVQDHGVIEIMRGCPNKCRFCHAGVYYRPFRQKSFERILEEARYLVEDCGYRDITLSSLSTGDYPRLERLVDALNRLYAHRRVSFSLPSLRVNSVTLSLLGQLNTVRKSGLTFAVETPTIKGQRGINKDVPAEKVIKILEEAKSQGWKLAKFYFMIGLPVDTGEDEAQSIVDYLLEVQRQTQMKLNVNLGTFIPKAHTPFELAHQLTDEEAMQRIRTIREGLRGNKKIRFSFHSPFVSYLEGILSRGDERAGELARVAWEKGACFDAWDDLMNKGAWREAIAEASWEVEDITCHPSSARQQSVPWEGVSLGITSKHLSHEQQQATEGELTPPCAQACPEHCGVCTKDCKVQSRESDDLPDFSQIDPAADGVVEKEQSRWLRMILRFKKFGPAMYLGHLDVMNVFQRAMQRANLPMDFTQGFNPKPRLEFAQPLSLGVSSDSEMAAVRLAYDGRNAHDCQELLNAQLPEGLKVTQAWFVPFHPLGTKNVKIMGAFWGADWRLTPPEGQNSQEWGQSLEQHFQDHGVGSDYSWKRDGDSLLIRMRHGGTRHHNLSRSLADLLGENPLIAGWRIHRLNSWAIGGEQKAIAFEDYYPPQSADQIPFA